MVFRVNAMDTAEGSLRKSSGALGGISTARLLTLQEAADWFRVSKRKLREHIRESRVHIPYLKIGRELRFDEAAMATLTESMRRPIVRALPPRGGRQSRQAVEAEAVVARALRMATEGRRSKRSTPRALLAPPKGGGSRPESD
jgi:excisionase family DNA binding protein